MNPEFLWRRLTEPPLPQWAVGATFVLSVALYWHGFGAGDPERYVQAGLDWLERGFHVGDTHWDLRHLFVLPIAASFALFGVNEFSATLPNIVYAGALSSLTFFFACRYIGKSEGFLAAIFIATSAFFVARPIELEIYGAEIFFAALACWLFVAAGVERRRLALLAAAGFAAGLAWLIREQTLYLMPVFGAFALLSRKDVLRALFALGLGFGAVIAAEWIFYAAAAGDPFFRYRVDLGHRTTGVDITLSSEDSTLASTILRPVKDLLAYPTTTPFLVLAAIAAAAGWRTALEPPARRRTFLVFGVMSAIALPVCAYAFQLSFPRYYPILTYVVYLALALAATEATRRFGVAAGAAFASAVIFLNAAAADFSRYGEYAESRFLARYLASASEPVATDPLTASRTIYQLRLLGLSAPEASRRIVFTTSPDAGALYFKSHQVSSRAANWCALEIAEVRPVNWTHYLLRWSGLDKVAGAKIRSVAARPAPVEIVRVLDRPVSAEEIESGACKAPQKAKRRPPIGAAGSNEGA